MAAVMIGAYAIAAVAVIVAVAVAAVAAVVSMGISREERSKSLTSNRTDPLTRSARRLTGAGCRLREDIQEVDLPRQDVIFAGQEGRIR
jgi:hypothetical protein